MQQVNNLKKGCLYGFSLTQRLPSMIVRRCFFLICFLFPFEGDCAQSDHQKYSLFPESALAHVLLDGLHGIEIGASMYNSFGLQTLNVDYSDDVNSLFKAYELSLCGTCAKVDIVSLGDSLPLADSSTDFVINSHVIEHFYDPVKAIEEWLRVVRPGGYVFMIVPHKERTFDKNRPRTTLAEIINRHEHPDPPLVDLHEHYSVWTTEDFVELCNYYQWPIIAVQDVDDKIGDGFIVVIMKP